MQILNKHMECSAICLTEVGSRDPDTAHYANPYRMSGAEVTRSLLWLTVPRGALQGTLYTLLLNSDIMNAPKF